MERLTVESLRQIAALRGYAWSEAELEAVRPTVERIQALLEKLESLPLRDVEPAVHYRISP